jgi:2-polyprenyl-3-methyl-5-hydroxy-6-metoxy-1,4-benzoquinol methylase
MSPLSNAYLSEEQLARAEPFYPLHAYVCGSCYLVQLEQFETPQKIFGDYAYFSSYSETWLHHAQEYARMAIERFALGPRSRVIEVASNDGYLLQYFRAADIPVLGIEPAANVACYAQERGIPTVVEFLGAETAKGVTADGGPADLVVGNNVFAHVPDLNDFAEGLRLLLKPSGVLTLEVPHLLRLIEQTQFDTIYHEHFSYFSLGAARRVLAAHGLDVFDVDELPTHGGSLRIYAHRRGGGDRARSSAVDAVERRESEAGFGRLSTYSAFGERVHSAKRALLRFLIQAKEDGKRVVGYGAPAKGNTLLNYCGVRTDLLEFTVDLSVHKQGRFLPGTHIPIFAPERIAEVRPDYVMILPWNLKDEIARQMAHVRSWGGRFVVPIPRVEVMG